MEIPFAELLGRGKTDGHFDHLHGPIKDRNVHYRLEIRVLSDPHGVSLLKLSIGCRETIQVRQEELKDLAPCQKHSCQDQEQGREQSGVCLEQCVFHVSQRACVHSKDRC